MGMPELTVVVNPAAGPRPGGGLPADLADQLPGARVIDVGDGPLVPALEQAAAGDVLGVAGGDGTVNAAVDVALRHGRRLAVFPGGTLNHFARDLGVASPADTVAGLLAGTTTHVDVGRIAGQPFLNTASVGSYPELVDEREQREGRLGKWLALAVATLVVMRRGAPMRLTVNGHRIRTWAIFIGNCEYGPPGLVPLTRPSLADGRFDVRWIDARMRCSRTRVTLALLAGRFGRSIAVGRLVADRIEIRSLDGPLRLARDGESFGGEDDVVVVEKDPVGLDVVVPPRG